MAFITANNSMRLCVVFVSVPFKIVFFPSIKTKAAQAPFNNWVWQLPSVYISISGIYSLINGCEVKNKKSLLFIN